MPAGTDDRGLQEAFAAAFLTIARRELGEDARLKPDTPLVYIDGPPVRLGDDPGGARYQASVQGVVLAPQR